MKLKMNGTILRSAAALLAFMLLAPAGFHQNVMTMPQGTMGVHGRADVSFTLRTGIADGKMVFIGRGGAIDGKVNPDLVVHEGDQVEVTLVNGEGAEHDIIFPDFHSVSPHVTGRGASATVSFRVGSAGSFEYFCDLPGHRDAGMEGHVKVELAPDDRRGPGGREHRARSHRHSAIRRRPCADHRARRSRGRRAGRAAGHPHDL